MSSTTEKGSASSLVPRTVPMDAKLMVATDPGDVKKLKEVVNKEDAVAMVVVTVTSKKPSEEHQSPTGNINPLLLSSARRGFCGTLNVLLEKEDSEIPPRIVASTAHDVEQGVDLHRGASLAPGALLKGVTPDGDTALHVVAGSNGDGEHFLKYAGIIHHRDKGFLFLKNCRGDTPLHCAARAGNSKMVSHLIDLAGREGADMKLRLLRMENNRHETVLHEAVRFEKGTILGHKEKEALLRGADLAEEENNKDGCPGAPEEKNIVKLLMRADPDLANYPADGVSPFYLAILLEKSTIALTLYYMSDRKLSYSGADGQNALHVSVLRDPVMIEFLVRRNKSLSSQVDNDRSKSLSSQVDNDRSTPLHFASSTWNVHTSVMLQTIFTANPAALYQSDKDGSFPIHVAASVGAIQFFHGKCKDSVGLRDAKGRTFLHVAVEKRRLFLVYYACRTPSLAWILNMQDNDGNTALHLAIQARSLRMFCALFGNLEVNLNVPNNNGETPLDISRSKLPRGLNYAQNSENKICRVLESVWAKHGARRCDKTEENYSCRVKPEDVDKESERLRNAAQSLITASVLIATMAFGATFALPRDYRVNDHTDGGAPVHAGSYCFDTFMMATTLAFICSSMGTIGFVFAATPMVSLFTRKVNFNISVFFMWSSVTCISIAFASGVYMVLASVAPSTAVAVCVITPVILLIASMEFIIKFFILARPLCVRKGLLRGMLRLLGMHMFMLAIICCPFVITFGWAALARIHRHH